MKLHELQPNEGKTKNRKRVGRGISAGQGKTAGRGTKGQKARAGGGTSLWHQGGNLPFFRRLPFKRGFTNIRKITYKPVNLGRLVEFDLSKTEVTPAVMADLGLLKKATDPVVILGDGEVNIALTVKAHRFSKSAREKIEAAGGTAEIIPLEE